MISLQVFTNCQEAEVFRNGISMGRKVNSFREPVLWNFRYAPGELKLCGYNNGDLVCEEVQKTALNAERINAVLSRGVLSYKENIVLVELSIEDKNGTLVPRYNDWIFIELTGPGAVIGLDNGDMKRQWMPGAKLIKANNGKAMVIVRLFGNKPASLNISTNGITSKKIELHESL